MHCKAFECIHDVYSSNYWDAAPPSISSMPPASATATILVIARKAQFCILYIVQKAGHFHAICHDHHHSPAYLDICRKAQFCHLLGTPIRATNHCHPRHGRKAQFCILHFSATLAIHRNYCTLLLHVTSHRCPHICTKAQFTY